MNEEIKNEAAEKVAIDSNVENTIEGEGVSEVKSEENVRATNMLDLDAEDNFSVESINLKQMGNNERNWYAVHTYSGYENAVLKNLKQRIDSLDVTDKIFDVVVPVEKKIKVKAGKRVEVEEKVYPGYVLVDMIVNDDTWYIVRNTPRVTGFVGAGNTPVPLTPKEVNYLLGKMQSATVTHELEIGEGEMVIVKEGPFKDFEGRVENVDKVRGKLNVLVNMFGRETPVELDFLQVNKI
jgi:transcriptional antiterminator NusG